MTKKRYNAKEILGKLQQAMVLIGQRRKAVGLSAENSSNASRDRTVSFVSIHSDTLSAIERLPQSIDPKSAGCRFLALAGNESAIVALRIHIVALRIHTGSHVAFRHQLPMRTRARRQAAATSGRFSCT